MTKTQARRIWKEAQAAARTAADAQLKELQAAGPRWAITEHENPLDDNSPIKRVVGTMLDVCGFAWLHFSNCNRKPTSTLVRYLKAQGIASKHYQGGYTARVPAAPMRQELSVKEAAARAAANVLQQHGITVYAQSRID